MNLSIIDAKDTPGFARAMVDTMSAHASVTIETSSSSVVDDEIVAWAVAIPEGDTTLVAAVAKKAPGTVVAMRVAAGPIEAMTMARSLVHRSHKRVAEGGLCPTHFGDLDDVPFSVRAPQFVVSPAKSWGSALPFQWAVGCTWTEMSLDPADREATVRARSPEGLTRGVLTPIVRALDGMFRSLRKAKEPLSSNAAWAMQAMMNEHLSLVRERLQDLTLVENLSEDRAELVGALVDSLNPLVLKQVSATSDGSPRVVLGLLRLPAKASGKNEDGTRPAGRVVAIYFYDAINAGRSKLATRHPESALSPEVTAAGFDRLSALFRKHRGVVLDGLGSSGELTLQRGFHADASLEDVRASFVADGFAPVLLVMDA